MMTMGIVIAGLMLIGGILHGTYFKGQLEKIKPYGQLIDVDDGQMHVYSMGNGEKTIVLLPGLGVGLPSADFGPLMRKLSDNHTVVTIEYFGVGFSSETSKLRTSENCVDEIRIALNQAGFEAPYVLMPHSISSVYSEHYAEKYPKEVKAIVSLDGTGTAYYEAMPAIVKSLFPIAKAQQIIGATSLIAPLAVNKKDLLSKGYTKKEISDLITFAGFSMNDTSLEQISNSAEFIKQTMELPFPESIPYFKVISKQTYETTNAPLKKAHMKPQEYQHNHLERIGQHAQYEVLEGTHFIYLNNVDRIVEITEDLLSEVNNEHL